MSDCLSVAANIAQIVGVVLAIIAAIYAYQQLKAAIASAESQAVLALDQTMAQYEGLRKKLNKGEFKNPNDDDLILLRRYVAVFERLGLLLKVGVVNELLADQLYGSRLEKLLKNSDDHVKSIISERDGRGWENFTYLWKQMHNSQGHRDLPEPPTLTTKFGAFG